MGSWSRSKKLSHLFRNQQARRMSTRLVEVGKFEEPQAEKEYKTGQPFLHRVFGYRGVLLFPWHARLYDHNLNLKSKDSLFVDDIPLSDTDVDDVNKESGDDKSNSDTSNSDKSGHELKFSKVTYYQTLINVPDRPHIYKMINHDAVMYLGQDNDDNLYALPGYDYVRHEDVLPYISSSDHPIVHEHFHKFFIPDATKALPWSPSKSLHTWHVDNYSWLRMCDVHRETTEGIRVTVIPFFMGVKRQGENKETFWWRYSILLENLTNEKVQLRGRQWKIFSLSSGTTGFVGGRGVVGQEPILWQKQLAYQYSSHVSLPTSTGNMWGTFQMERANGSLFEVRIPMFPLKSK